MSSSAMAYPILTSKNSWSSFPVHWGGKKGAEAIARCSVLRIRKLMRATHYSRKQKGEQEMSSSMEDERPLLWYWRKWGRCSLFLSASKANGTWRTVSSPATHFQVSSPPFHFLLVWHHDHHAFVSSPWRKHHRPFFLELLSAGEERTWYDHKQAENFQVHPLLTQLSKIGDDDAMNPYQIEFIDIGLHQVTFYMTKTSDSTVIDSIILYKIGYSLCCLVLILRAISEKAWQASGFPLSYSTKW